MTRWPVVQRLGQRIEQWWRIAEAPEQRVRGQRWNSTNELMEERGSAC
ncbi:MAG: hypothetical protein RMM98_00900 [Acidobacteriota bacterium]|nr:hypothetical protein [Blastocatellia bacterium]MDW8238145.1 hypothetical protein [Acidobacteriota bacterium]